MVSRAPSPSAPPEQAAPPDVVPDHYHVRHEPSNLGFTDDPAEIRQKLESFVDSRDSSDALSLFDSDAGFVGPVPVISLPGQACDLPGDTCERYRRDVVRLVRQEVGDLRFRMSQFGSDFVRRANDTLHLLLTDSEEKINAEKERYGLRKKEGTFSFLFDLGTEYSMNNPGALSAAAKALLEKYLALKAATEELANLAGFGGTLPPGGAPEGNLTDELARAEADAKARERDYGLLRKQKEEEFPILMTYDLDPLNENTHGLLATLSSDSGAAETLYKQVEEKLTNIRTTREYALGHPDLVWKLPMVLGATERLPDIVEHPKLRAGGLQKIVVEEAARHTTVVKLVENAAIAAVVVGLSMIATPLAGAGLRIASAAATATDAGISVALMLKSIREYQAEQAATNTDLDSKARSISQEEPSLLWLAFEIVMTVAQLRTAAQEFTDLVRLSRAATAAKVARNEPEAQRLLDELAHKGDGVKPGAGVGDRLRREAEDLGTSAGQDAGEIAANLDNVVESTMAGYTHEVPMGGGKFWRRTVEGSWCYFASAPKCPLGVKDQLLAPEFANLPIETITAIMGSRTVRATVRTNPQASKLLEKYGVDGVKAMRHARAHGWDGFDILRKFDQLDGRVKGTRQLLKDLAAGESTTKGAIAEIHYLEKLLDEKVGVKRVGDWIGGRKAADVVLKDNSIVDVKYYDWTSWVWSSAKERNRAIEEMLDQVALRKAQYPNRKITYVFAGAGQDIPQPVRTALENAGVKVQGFF